MNLLSIVTTAHSVLISSVGQEHSNREDSIVLVCNKKDLLLYNGLKLSGFKANLCFKL